MKSLKLLRSLPMALLLGLGSVGSDQAFSFSFDSTQIKQVKESGEAILKIFSGQPYGNYNICDGGHRVGGVSFEGQKVSIAYGGARTPRENMGCIWAGNGDVHADFLKSYENFRVPLFKSIKEHGVQTHISGNDLIFQITGHSRGGGYVPQTVEEIKKEYPSAKLSAFVFSPLDVYSHRRAYEYNKRFWDVHFNFQADEDTVPQWVQFGQRAWSWGMDMGGFLEEVGKTVTFSVESLPEPSLSEFKAWVRNDPYAHLALPRIGGPQLLSFFGYGVTPLRWAAHMAEFYAKTHEILAGRVFKPYHEKRKSFF